MAFKEFLQELYQPMGGVTVRAMFGGLGVFKDGLIFALGVDDVLYLKADAKTEPRFAAEKSAKFIYKGMKGRQIAMPYWRVPDRLYDDPDEFLAWSNAAFDVARQGAAEKAKGKRPAAKKAVAKKPPVPTKAHTIAKSKKAAVKTAAAKPRGR
jgi:DNA transformation protein